jgi:hypothetical protein
VILDPFNRYILEQDLADFYVIFTLDSTCFHVSFQFVKLTRLAGGSGGVRGSITSFLIRLLIYTICSLNKSETGKPEWKSG